MAEEYRVPLLRDEEGQFVLLPPAFEFARDDLVMRKEGDRLVIEIAEPKPPLPYEEPHP